MSRVGLLRIKRMPRESLVWEVSDKFIHMSPRRHYDEYASVFESMKAEEILMGKERSKVDDWMAGTAVGWLSWGFEICAHDNIGGIWFCRVLGAEWWQGSDYVATNLTGGFVTVAFGMTGMMELRGNVHVRCPRSYSLVNLFVLERPRTERTM